MSRALAPRRGLLAAVIALLVSAAPASAQTNYFWNAGTGGDGNWDTSTTNWSLTALGPPDQAWINDGSLRANFGDAVGTVTLQTGITADSLAFTTSGYV